MAAALGALLVSTRRERACLREALEGKAGDLERLQRSFSRFAPEEIVERITVNLAARVQTLTRQYEVDILVTSSVRDHLDPRFRLRELPATEVRGIAEPVAIYAAVDFDEGLVGSASSSHSV